MPSAVGEPHLPGFAFGWIVVLGPVLAIGQPAPRRLVSVACASTSRACGASIAWSGTSTRMTRMVEPSVQAPCVTPGGSSTASPWLMAVRSAPTCTQPPPAMTMRRPRSGLVCGGSSALRANANSVTRARGSAQMVWSASPRLAVRGCARRKPGPKRRISTTVAQPLVSAVSASSWPWAWSWGVPCCPWRESSPPAWRSASG